MGSYDLITQQWIPVVDRRSGKIRNVGLKNALLEAHSIREVHGDTPLETVSINRLLLALWFRIFGEQTESKKEWFRLWEGREEGFGSDERETIEKYFVRDGIRDRFDLLHSERPFYQWVGLPSYLTSKKDKNKAGIEKRGGKKKKEELLPPINRIFSEESSGNNPTLFAHNLNSTPRQVSLAKAVRGVVATQATALGGGHSVPFYLVSAPLVLGTIFWLRGNSLYEALLLNAPPSGEARMGGYDNDDQPVWEQSLIDSAKERGLDGYLDYLTFQSRRLMLIRDEGNTVATGIWFAQGDKIKASDDDPLMAYRSKKNSTSGREPYQLKAERALWRDSTVFLNLVRDKRGSENDPSHAPRTFEWVANNLPQHRFETDAFGFMIKTRGPGAIEFWRHERMPLITDYLKEPDLYRVLKLSIDNAEKQEQNLTNALKVVARKLLYPEKENLSKENWKELGKLTAALGGEQRYWAYLEPRFYQLLEQIPNSYPDHLDEVENSWQEVVQRVAKRAFREATNGLQSGSRHLHALAQGEAELARRQSKGQTKPKKEKAS